MTHRHILSILTAGALALSLSLPLPAAALSDVDSGDWFADAVEHCLKNDIMDAAADGVFAPQAPMTRAVLAQALYRLAGSPPVAGSDPVYDPEREAQQYPFSDVDAAGPWGDPILWAWRAGLMSGYPDGRFRPEDPLTREQMAAVFWQAQGRQPAGQTASFTDRNKIAAWAVNGVEWVWSVGLMTGKDGGRFDPAGTTTRAECAVILRNYDQRFVSPPEEPEPDLPAPDFISQPIPPNRYDSERFVLGEDGFLTYEDRRTVSRIGIDVSSHQKQIDWEQVADAGVEFAIIRAGYRGYTEGSLYKDSYFTYNIQHALDNGIEVGVYFYSQALTPQEAAEEAKLVLGWIEDYEITYPVVFDWEEVSEDTSRTKDAPGETVTACALTFCSLVEEAGYIPMTYGSPSKVYNGGIQLEYLQDWPFWLAHYTVDQAPTSFRYHFDMWQYTSNGEVPGIPTRVDVNLCLTDWSEW